MKSKQINWIILFSFIIPLLFWAYLSCSTAMDVSADARGYNDLADRLLHGGFKEYLKDGPTREPLYPLLIALSKKLSSFFKTHFSYIIVVMQLSILFLTQLLIYTVLKRVKVNNTITALIILYFGMSPAMINSALSLFSEIITYPMIMFTIILSVLIWQNSLKENIPKVVFYSILFTLNALLAISSKHILEYVYLFYLIPFIILMITQALKRKMIQSISLLLFMTIFLSGYAYGLSSYRNLNQQIHGLDTYKDYRAPFIIYGYAQRRTAPVTKNLLLGSILSIPGQAVCEKYDPQACNANFKRDVYLIAYDKKAELLKDGFPENEIHAKLMQLSKKLILTKPFQYAFFNSMESMKFFFWESTQVSFVFYPKWLTHLHDMTIVRNGLRLIVALVTFAGIFWGFILLIKRKRDFLAISDNGYQYQYFFFSLYFCLLFACLYSPVFVATRYAFPIVCLYCIVLGISLQSLSKASN